MKNATDQLLRARTLTHVVALVALAAAPATAAGRAQALAYATYFGGTGDDTINAVAVDDGGFITVVGQTFSKKLKTMRPIQRGSELPAKAGQAFVTRFFPDGRSLVFSTYLGGAKGASATCVAVDDAGFVYVAGFTSSRDFPTRTPIQRRPGGGADMFLTKISPGGALVASTYFGGAGSDLPAAIRIGPDGGVFVVGQTSSADFPATLPPIGSPVTEAGVANAFVVKVDASMVSIDYAVTIGGSNPDAAVDVAVDGAGAATIAGSTASPDFPTLDAVQPEYGGDLDEVRTGDGFVARLDPAGALAYGTFLGGSSRDSAAGVALGADGTIYVAGTTASPDFPTVGFDPPDPDPSDFGDAFLAALAPDGSRLIFSRPFGGDLFDGAVRLVLDASGDPLVVGTTRSSGLATPGAVQPEPAGGDDAFVATFDAATGEVLTATYLGAEFDDDPNGVAVAPDGSAVVVGQTSSAGFPTTPDAFQPERRKAQSDGFVARLTN